MDDLDIAGEFDPSTSQTNPAAHTGITLVLPSLRAIKAANAGKKSKGKHVSNGDEQRLKIPRPIKLKPLKEVLAKLITQIKKKDDYAFFLSPVDPAQVPGYGDVIKNPMDFGTITLKVNKGKYRSLEDFTNDFRLVTTNAKIFNPPGTIYHSEAERIESWGLDHISRASAHVIEYETDWNIDVEQDDDLSTSQHLNIDDEVSTPRDVDGSMVAASPAPSMTPAPQGPGAVKRGPRGPYKKHAPSMLSEGLDAEGRMPGAKDGVGAFPPGSDWADLMLALKIKGKRYRTKKERLKFEKEGPPYHPDGSLNYFEMEDPYSILNVFVPDPPSRPQVTPLYPPPSIPLPLPLAMPQRQLTTIDPTQLQSQPYLQPPAPPPPPPPPISAPTPIAIPPERPTPVLSTLIPLPLPPTTASTPTSTTTTPRPPKKRRHWTIVRNAPSRRTKDKDATDLGSGVGGVGVGGAGEDRSKAGWKVPREVGPAEWGSLAVFLGELAGAGGGVGTGTAAEYLYGSEHRLFATIRSTVEHRAKRKREVEEDEGEGEVGADTSTSADESALGLGLWSDDDAVDGWDYLRHIVYGGVDGYAYVRSLAEFVGPSVYHQHGVDLEMQHWDQHQEEDGNDAEEERKPPSSPLPTHLHKHEDPLGVPLARYIEDNLVDPITCGRHGFLRDVFLPLALDVPSSPSLSHSYLQWSKSSQLRSLSLFDARLTALKARGLLDMAALIRTPEELAKESVVEGWAAYSDGEDGKNRGEARGCTTAWAQVRPGSVEEREAIGRALAWSAGVIETLSAHPRVNEGGVKLKVKVKKEDEEEEDAMDVNVGVDPKPEPDSDSGSDSHSSSEEQDPDAGTEEDPLLKRLRMNLLALAKRAPVNRIGNLPADLVPESIRGMVPTA